MDLFAVVDQVIELLRSRGRVSYRVLKLQLQLDDDAIEALRTNLSTRNTWLWMRMAGCWSGRGDLVLPPLQLPLRASQDRLAAKPTCQPT
jgi:hypothetical protein